MRAFFQFRLPMPPSACMPRDMKQIPSRVAPRELLTQEHENIFVNFMTEQSSVRHSQDITTTQSVLGEDVTSL